MSAVPRKLITIFVSSPAMKHCVLSLASNWKLVTWNPIPCKVAFVVSGTDCGGFSGGRLVSYANLEAMANASALFASHRVVEGLKRSKGRLIYFLLCRSSSVGTYYFRQRTCLQRLAVSRA